MINKAKKTCFTTRNGCSDYEQLLSLESSEITKIIVEETGSMVAVVVGTTVKIIKYDQTLQ